MLLESVQSVLSQTHMNLELLVVDNGSTDNTLISLATIQDARLKVFLEPRRGAAYARNTGIKNATGEFLAFLDSDDLWLPAKLETQLRRLGSSAEPQMVFTQYREFDQGNREKLMNPRQTSMSLSVITLMVPKKDFLRVGYFDESLSSGEFMEWYARALQLSLRITSIDETLALRRLHAGNALSKSRFALDYLKACRTILAKKSP